MIIQSGEKVCVDPSRHVDAVAVLEEARSGEGDALPGLDPGADLHVAAGARSGLDGAEDRAAVRADHEASGPPVAPDHGGLGHHQGRRIAEYDLRPGEHPRPQAGAGRQCQVHHAQARARIDARCHRPDAGLDDAPAVHAHLRELPLGKAGEVARLKSVYGSRCLKYCWRRDLAPEYTSTTCKILPSRARNRFQQFVLS